MSLITQCPACATMFRVVPDQLRISEGWVRCGQCDEVFDANAHLRTLEELRTATAHAPLAAEQLAEPAAQRLTESAPDPDAPSEYDWGSLVAHTAPVAAIEAPVFVAPDMALEMPGGTGEASQPPDAWREPLALDEPAGEGVLATPPVDAADDATEHSLAPAQVSGEVPVPIPALPEDIRPSFMAPADVPAPAQHGPGALGLLGLCAVLLALLAAQGLWLHRDRLAATAPALQPLLQAGCELLACKLLPLREIEGLAIDSSAFTNVRPGVYLLKVTLKNTMALELATPALELTLTDAQDQPLLRRVLLPVELSGKPAIAAAAELGASLPIAVEPGATPEKIAGYRLLAFYP